MANALVPTRGEELMFMPVMDMEVAIARRNYVVDFVKRIMVEGVDYGKIPGAGDKPTLLKPGAEKLSTFFGLTPIFIPIAVIEDWTGADHKGEPFFYYRYRCELHRNGVLVASSEGSCNTWESKYRYRKGERVCPNCGQAAIIKGKAEYGGGWICFAKKGGCGSKFNTGDKGIESQEVGRIINPDIADQVNTVQKMAQKRSLIAATLLAVNASEFFTQDIEDMAIEGEWTTVVESPQTKKAESPKNGANSHATSKHTTPTQKTPQGATVQATVDDNPFEDTTPYYVRDWNQLTGKEYDLVQWASSLHKTSDGPCTAKQYQYLSGLVDTLTGNQHSYLLSLLCQAEISKTNMPGAKMASALLKLITPTKKGKDEQGNEIDAPNPDYRADVAEMLTRLAQPVAVAA